MEQGLCKLKANKKKEFKVEMAYIVKIESIDVFNPHLLPLSGSFDFNFSFLILPDVISDNIPVFFFIEYFKFSFSFYIVFFISFLLNFIK